MTRMTNETNDAILANTTELCWKCLGTGRLTWTSNANGVCFECKGTGSYTRGAYRGKDRGVHTFAGADGVVWQFAAVNADCYTFAAQPNDPRTERVMVQALKLNAERPRASVTPLRANVSPSVGRKAYAAARAGATVAEVAAVLGITDETKPASWFSRNRHGLEAF